MPGRAPAGGAAAGAAEARSPRRGKGNPPPLLAAPPRSRCQRPPAGPSAAGSLLPCGRSLPRGVTHGARDSDSDRDPPGPPPPAEGRAALRARCLGRPGPARAGEGPGALPCAVTSRGREASQGLSDISALQASPAPARRDEELDVVSGGMSAFRWCEGDFPGHSLENAFKRRMRTYLRSQQRGNPVSFKHSNRQDGASCRLYWMDWD
ncbi:uncharacterized protein ACIQIH_006953 [Cyanocitta cristata]